MMYKLFHNLYIGTSGKPSPTDIENTFVLYFVGRVTTRSIHKNSIVIFV